MYELHVTRPALKDIASLPKEYAELVSRHIDELESNPRPPGSKRLQGRTDYSFRVGIYRILYEIDDERHIVTVFRVKHRRDVYR